MPRIEFSVSLAAIEACVVLPWAADGGGAWDRAVHAFLTIALGGRSVWIASTEYSSDLAWDEAAPDEPVETHTLSGKIRADFAFVESFAASNAHAIASSTDFRTDAIYLFPARRDELGTIAALLDRLDLRLRDADQPREFVYSIGDGIGLRWIKPERPDEMGKAIRHNLSEAGWTFIDAAEPI